MHSNQPDIPGLPAGEYSRVLCIPRLPRALRPVRDWVRDTLAGWGLGTLAESGAQITSELAANALAHARGEGRLTLLMMYAAGTVRMEVRDDDAINLPAKRNPADADTSGRGLAIVEALSQRWGVRVTDCGKSVWAELDVRPRRTSASTVGTER